MVNLLTKELKKRFAKVGSQDGKGDGAIVVVKFFDPCGSWTWLATEAYAALDDGTEIPLDQMEGMTVEDVIFFGFVVGQFPEWGSFSKRELEKYKGPLGLGIERDLYWTEKTVKEALSEIGASVSG